MAERDDNQAEQGDVLRPVHGRWDDVLRLFCRASPTTLSHWNPESGEVFELPRGKQRAATAERFETRLWREPQWLEIPYEESDEAFAAAQRFVAELRPGKARGLLTAALDGPKPFRAFRAVLAAHPGLQRRWSDAQAERGEMRLVEFCLAQGICLTDPQFEQALERWLDARDAEEAEDAPRVVPVAARRGLASLSLGRHSESSDE